MNKTVLKKDADRVVAAVSAYADSLDARIAELEAALTPFAALGARVRWIDGGYVTTRIRTADIVAAQKALNK